MTNFEKLYLPFKKASAFVVDGRICGDFSLSYLDDSDDDGIGFYVYGERGLFREYYIDKDILNNGRIGDFYTLTVTYHDGKDLTIMPLFPKSDLGD